MSEGILGLWEAPPLARVAAPSTDVLVTRDLGTDMDVLSLFGRQECLHFPKVSLELELGPVQLGAEPIDGSLRHLSRLGLARYLACWKARYCFRNVFGYAR